MSSSKEMAIILAKKNPDIQFFYSENSVAYGNADGRLMPLLQKMIPSGWGEYPNVCVDGRRVADLENWEPLTYDDITKGETK